MCVDAQFIFKPFQLLHSSHYLTFCNTQREATASPVQDYPRSTELKVRAGQGHSHTSARTDSTEIESLLRE